MGTISAGEPTLAGAAWRYWRLVLITVAAVVAVGLIYAEVRPAVYTATATMVVADPHSSPVFATSSSQPPDRYTGDQIAVLSSPQLAAAAAAVGAAESPPLGLSADDFSRHTAVSGTPSTGNLLKISFSAGDAATALAAVDAIKTAYEHTVHDAVGAELSTLLAQIDTEVGSITAQLTAVNAQLAVAPPAGQAALVQQQAALVGRRNALAAKRDQVAVDAASGETGVALYLPALTATHTSRLVAALPLLSVAAVLGLAAGVLAAYVLASRRRVAGRRGDPEIVLGVPLVAEIPRFGATRVLPVVDGQPAAAAAAFRGAALVIQGGQAADAGRAVPRRPAGATARRQVRRLLAVSAARREGRSTLVANLGIALADLGVDTLLVDADPLTAGLSRLLDSRFALGPAVGTPIRLSAGGMSMEDVVLPAEPLGRLALLRVGHARRALDGADRDGGVDSALEELEGAFGVVLIDGPPLGDAGPYWPLLTPTASALVVVTDSTPVAQLEELSRLLGAIDMPAFGYLYNHRPPLRPAASTVEKGGPDVSSPSSGAGLRASA